MLVLTRHHGQSIIIDNNIKVKVMFDKNHGSNVRLVIDAPQSITVHREEIQRKINREIQEMPQDKKDN